MPLGEVVEWFMALVLKTSVSARAPSVRIRPSPCFNQAMPSQRLGFLLPSAEHRAPQLQASLRLLLLDMCLNAAE